MYVVLRCGVNIRIQYAIKCINTIQRYVCNDFCDEQRSCKTKQKYIIRVIQIFRQ